MTTQQKTETVEITARAKAFAGQGVREHDFQVESDGTVRVWDPIAEHYTLCNSLSERAKNRIRTLAAAE